MSTILVLTIIILIRNDMISGVNINCTHPPINMDIRDCCPIPDIINDHKDEVCEIYESVPGLFSLSPCYVECIFNTTKIYTSNAEINQTAVKDFLQNSLKNNKEFLPVMTNGFVKCTEEVNKFISSTSTKKIPTYFPQCSSKAAIITACVQADSFINCPSEKWRGGLVCNNGKEFLKKCSNF